MIAEIILAVLLIIAGVVSGLFALLIAGASAMGNPDDDTGPFLIALALAIAGIGGGIAILVF